MNEEKIEQHRAIPYGGVKFLGMMAIFVGMGVLMTIMLVMGHAQPDPAARLVSITELGLLMSIIYLILAHLKTWTWLKTYWRQNVVGYTLCCVYNPTMENPRFTVWPRGEYIIETFAIILPLGGWFHRARIVCHPNYRPRVGVPAAQLLTQWRVRVVAMYTSTRVVIVRLTDRGGDHIPCRVEDALTLLEEYAAKLEHFGNDVGSVVSSFVIGRDVDQKKIAGLRQQLVDATSALQQEKEGRTLDRMRAYDVIQEAVHRINQTSRFVSSLEALRIRVWLLEELKQRAEPLDDLHITKELLDARAALERREAARQKRDRHATA